MSLVVGHDNQASIQLANPDGTLVTTIVGATSVTVALEAADRSAKLAGPYTALTGTAGANWAAGIVGVVFLAADLAAAIAAVGAPSVRIHVLVVLAGVSTDYYTPLVPLLKGYL